MAHSRPLFGRFGPGATLAAALLLAGCEEGTGPDQVPAALTLSTRQVALAEGASDTLMATVLDRRGRPIQGLPVQWSASDAGVVSVDGSGVVRGRKPGSAYVVAAVTMLNGSGVRDSAQVTVSPAPARIVAGGMNGSQVAVGVKAGTGRIVAEGSAHGDMLRVNVQP